MLLVESVSGGGLRPAVVIALAAQVKADGGAVLALEPPAPDRHLAAAVATHPAAEANAR